MPVRRKKPVQRLSRSEEQAGTKARLLDAAAEVIARRGVERASLDEMAAHAGLTKGAIYSNFTSKDDVVAALIDTRLEHHFRRLETAIDPSAELTKQTAQAAEVWLAAWVDSQESFLLSIEFALHLGRHPDLRTHFAERYSKLRAKYAHIVQDHGAAADGQSPLPAEQMSIIYIAMIEGLSLAKLTQPEAVPDELFSKALEVIAAGSKHLLAERRPKPADRPTSSRTARTRP
ncbi:MAG: TetR/AcrR family transcriptional regulator [Mycobacterium sp.]